MTDEQLELVTAYVDGVATEDERAIVAANAELMAEVDRQRSLRSALHDVTPAPAESREAAIAAALAVFDEEYAPVTMPPGPDQRADVPAPTNIVPLAQRRRLRWMQGLGAAAAAAVVVAAGAVIATRGGDDDGTAADEQQPAATSPLERDTKPDDPAAIPTTVGPELMAAAEASATEPLDEDTPAGAADETASQDAEDAEDAAGAPAESPTAPAPAAAPPTTTAARLIVIITEDDLAALADEIKPEPPAVEGAHSACESQSLKADATFEDDAGARHPVAVVIIDGDTFGALALDSCEIVLQTER